MTVPTTNRVVSFNGRDRHGVARSGQRTVTDVDVFVESLYKLGWCTLTVTDAVGVEVGRIQKLGNGHRTWWAEVVRAPNAGCPS